MITVKIVKEITADIVDSSKYNRKQLAGLLEVDYNTLCRWANFNLDTHVIPPDQIVKLYQITKDARLLEVIAKDAGFILFPAKSGMTKEQIAGLHKLLPLMETMAKTYEMLLDDEVQQLVSSFGQTMAATKGTNGRAE
jgi:hypothetical protein